MISDTFYMIEPRPDLPARLEGRLSSGLIEVLLTPLLMRNAEGGKSAWVREDYGLIVKISFLASLNDYDELASDETFLAVFGSPRLSATMFDRWWRLHCFEFEESTEDLRPAVRRWQHLIEPTGNIRADDWLRRAVSDG